jgi:hypothetical protein
MQSETGCKINVSQASGADIEREIGLVGSRQAIDDAKQAIWDKVDQVVSRRTLFSWAGRELTIRRGRRTTADGVIMVVRIITTHNSSSPSSPTVRLLLKDNPLHPQQVLLPAVQLIRTPSMVATRTIWRCGTHLLLNSSSKGVHHQVHQVPRLPLVRDHAYDAETAA